MQSPPNAHVVAKHTLTLLNTLYEATKKSAAMQGLEANELIVELLMERTIKDGTLDGYTQMRFQITREVIAEVVRVARLRCREGKFTEDITRDTIKECCTNTQWTAAYRILVGDDIYKHGNPLKVVNREFGYRIKAAIGGTVKKGDDGKAVTVKVNGMIIQSYTLMEDFDPECVGGIANEEREAASLRLPPPPI